MKIFNRVCNIKAKSVGGGMRQVFFIDVTTTATSSKWDARNRKQRLRWRNRARNTIIASVARALVEDDKNTLSNLGIVLPNTDVKSRIVILVEGTEHANQLHRCLPDWAVCSSVPTVSAKRNENKQAQPAGKIITLVYAMHNRADADILIRATGGSGGLRLGSSRWKPPSLIIDFNDAEDMKSRLETNARVDQYRAENRRIHRSQFSRAAAHCEPGAGVEDWEISPGPAVEVALDPASEGERRRTSPALDRPGQEPGAEPSRPDVTTLWN
jgi:hypothetical protein